jgi:hypothetical protein
MLRFEEGEIAAAAERGAGAGEYHAACLGIAIQVMPDVEQLAVQGRVDDVVRLRAIDRHNPNGAVRRYQKFVAHGVGFLARAQSCFFAMLASIAKLRSHSHLP